MRVEVGMVNTLIAENLNEISLQIAKAERQRPANYHADEYTTLIAASKLQSLEAIETAYHLGIRHFGENYVQEGVEKIQSIALLQKIQPTPDIVWHLIGPLQSNKVKLAAEHFDWVDSVHSLKLLKKLSEHRRDQLPPINVCLQVNIDQASTKQGFMPESDELLAVMAEAAKLDRVCVRGIMVMPDIHEAATLKHYFKSAYQLFLKLQAECNNAAFDTLSMGMSQDYPLAISQGATMIRLGSALFGARPASN